MYMYMYVLDVCVYMLPIIKILYPQYPIVHVHVHVCTGCMCVHVTYY